MSRRETFLESAKAANAQALGPPTGTTGAEPTAPLLQTLVDEIARLRESVARQESRLPEGAGPLSRDRHSKAPAGRVGPLTWVLAGSLVTVLLLSALRPDWDLRPEQRNDLALGQRMHRLLDSMEGPERSKVLDSLWDPTLQSATSD